MQHLIKKSVIELLLLPLALLLIGFSIQKVISDRQEDLVVTQMVDSYFSGVANQLTTPSVINTSVIIARTRALFYRLRQLNRKDEIINVLRFISEVSPDILHGDVFEQDPQIDKYYVNFSGIQLSDASLGIIEISDLRIFSSNFDNSHFYNFSCQRCGFTGSSFKNAEFTDVDFEGSNFSRANFLNSNIKDAYIENAIFDGAIWTDGRKCGKNSIGKCN